MLNNQTIFFFFFLTYGVGLFCFPLLKKGISSRLYTVSNFFLLLLQSIGLIFNGFSVSLGESSFTLIAHSLTTFTDIIVGGFVLSITPLSFYFSLLVLLIGCATNLYILSYFRNEADEMSFVFWLNAFVFSMLILVFSSNFYTLFLGWELIGLTSFFLINFWNTRRGTLKSSFKAFSFNLVSDIFLLSALVCFYYSSGVTDLDTFIHLSLWGGVNSSYLLKVGLVFLVLCASIKSVQIFGHLWLPDSMEAPVPASSLIHSATLVSAGIYLLMRFNILYQVFNYQQYLIVWGSFTAAYGGVVASTQTDMKKLLAYSTMSHCGFLWVLACTGNFYITILYLFIHGFFKAATFYCSGNFIRIFGSQDTRTMGLGHRTNPLDTFLLLICATNLAGLPLTLGFIYKTFFFSVLLQGGWGFVIVVNLLLGSLTSIVYFFRLTYYAVFDYYKGYQALSTNILQVNHQFVNVASNTPRNHFLAIIIIILSAFTSLYFFLWILSVNIQPITFSGVSFGLEGAVLSVSQTYFTYLLYFYYTYIILICLLFFINWRPNILKLEYILAAMYILVIFLFNMWGHIMTEASTLQNFNFGFSTHKSDILIHLSQWQYWWWFWFTLFWSLYFFIIINVINKRIQQFNPIINTSIRGHGKWGDFLVALIPLSWCGNILVNSNFILRMIEWQNEGSLFTLRVQGKQWYWVYKFDGTSIASILSAPKNVGHNNWVVLTPNESYTADSYYEALHMGAQLEYMQLYYKFLKDDKITRDIVNSWKNKFNNVQYSSTVDDAVLGDHDTQPSLNNTINTEVNFNKPGFYDNELLDDTSKYMSNILESVNIKPLNILSGVLNKHNLEVLNNADDDFKKPILFVPIFSENGSLFVKPEHVEPHWGFKQKKYKRLQKFKFINKVEFNPQTLEAINISNTNPFALKSSLTLDDLNNNLSNKFVVNHKISSFNYHRSVKFNRHRAELVPVTLARRLLRTKRTLVLPAHVNITVVTNSYDVVHSWFIPGLGLKLDCVPGRSTHHSFYIDNVGFYYGQCAEICGRYHHHMPIRLCALPFEQFLVWWQKRGVKRMHRIGVYNEDKVVNTNQIKFRYKW